MNKKKNCTLICLLDKEWPPNHSFIDGMLAGELAKTSNIYVRLMVSRSKNLQSATKYINSTCVPLLFKRNGIWRFLNLFQSLKLLLYQIKREKLRNKDVILFVRNDPILLLSASLLRSKVSRLIFQSSFPHEKFNEHNLIKRWIAKILFQLFRFKIDAFTCVSPLGLLRVQALFNNKKIPNLYIPLLTEFIEYPKKDKFFGTFKYRPVFVYIGSHNKQRELKIVFNAIYKCVEKGVEADFVFVGCTESEFDYLQKIPKIKSLIKSGRLFLKLKIPRQDIPKLLSRCHVGICLIPPKPIYIESSPTKLAEYMGAGLAVLTNKGIPMQEKFIMESGGGLLVNWNVQSIADGIEELVKEKNLIEKFGEKSKKYAKNNLQYKYYVNDMVKILLNR